ncbi:MAG: AAA family ATPase [Candidatus Gastranaerophilales bacterium]|nr:AAA family ATPase [Candidatus Gastranaerophilales bacterium]
MSCKKCGFTFVKFCPSCHSANYASSSICRKCGTEFINEQTTNPQEPIMVEEKPKEQKEAPIEPTAETQKEPLLFYVDFINLDNTFEKYNKDEFKQKVVENIKTTVKIAFNTDCEFINSHTVLFKYNYSKNIKILDKIAQFELEFEKFNKILEKSLNNGLTFKFAIATIDEVRKNGQVPQLKYGSEKDVVVSSGAYGKLSNELSLIKISANSYKLIFLDQKPAFEQSEDEKYDKALEIILNNLADNSSQVRAISVNAPRGVGKTHLLSELYSKVNKAKSDKTLIFYAQCSALTQVSMYGLIQNFFISFFDCPNVLKEEFNLKKFEKKILNKLNLEKIDEENLKTLANLIYPIKKDYFENILINKEITYKHLKDVFDYIKSRKNIIFIIDDFDLIDESSYGFLKYLVQEDYFEKNAKLILGYKNEHSIAIYFQTNKLNNNNCLNISLRKLTIQESKSFIKKVLGANCDVPEEILSQIAYNAQGNIAYIEQILQYLFERKILTVKEKTVQFKKDKIDMEIPKTLEDCFYERLDFLKENDEREYIFLNTASLLGDRLDYRILSSVFQLSENDFFEIVEKLEKRGYLKKKADDIYGFKNSLTWSYCYIKAKEEELIKEDAKRLLIELNNKTITSPLICPILAQIIGNKELAYSLWTNSLQYANYIGDVNIYAMAQKQSLILLENVKLDNFEYTKNNICERLGKLIYTKTPSEAKDYLSNALTSAQKNENTNKIIDLSGYLVKSAYLTQDFTAVVEIVDNVLKIFNKKEKTEKKSSFELQVALIKARKLEALLNLGAWEEIASIVNSEINPTLQKHLSFFKKHKWITQGEIFFTWIEANIILAQSYSQQGSPLAFELISEIDKVLSKEKDSKLDILKVRLKYASAMANTSKGYFDESDLILQEIVKDFSYVIDAPNLVSQWNIISIINKVLRLDYSTIKEELFEASAYANNCNDEVSKNLIKTLLAYVMLQEKSYLKAIEVATEEMQYFSSKKIAFGALLAWYISAASTLANKCDTYCIEICEKAVKICENAQNNNNYFKIMFQELLAKAYMKLNDMENAQMYCDLGLQSANINDLLYSQLKLYNLKTTIAREKLKDQADNKKYDYAMNVIKMYNRTLDLAKRLNLKNYVKKIDKELVSFKAHCQLNRIIEDK